MSCSPDKASKRGSVAAATADPLFSKNGPTALAELEHWCSQHVPGYVGYVSGSGCNLHDSIRPGASFLVNIDSSHGIGTHWTALRISTTASKIALYVDSMGYPPPRPVTELLRANGYEVLYSDARNQRADEPLDATCGQRACLALHAMANSPSLPAGDMEAFATLAGC